MKNYSSLFLISVFALILGACSNGGSQPVYENRVDPTYIANNFNKDAVAAIFQQDPGDLDGLAQAINDPSINNLDLNGDGLRDLISLREVSTGTFQVYDEFAPELTIATLGFQRQYIGGPVTFAFHGNPYIWSSGYAYEYPVNYLIARRFFDSYYRVNRPLYVIGVSRPNWYGQRGVVALDNFQRTSSSTTTTVTKTIRRVEIPQTERSSFRQPSEVSGAVQQRVQQQRVESGFKGMTQSQRTFEQKPKASPSVSGRGIFGQAARQQQQQRQEVRETPDAGVKFNKPSTSLGGGNPAFGRPAAAPSSASSGIKFSKPSTNLGGGSSGGSSANGGSTSTKPASKPASGPKKN